MNLTTPTPADLKSVFPGENWFFYWKASLSIWEQKLRQFPHTGKILVPINWAFHSETGQDIDFGKRRPEAKLKKLWEMTVDLGREMAWLLPLTPMPIFPNGGLPAVLARHASMDVDGVRSLVLNRDQQIHHLYSFFDPRCYQAYSHFTKSLSDYFSREGIAAPVWGVEAGYIEKATFQSYFEDRSEQHQLGFEKFLEAKRGEKNETVLQGDRERELMEEFKKTIFELYQNEAQKRMSTYWEGSFKVSFLGGSRTDFFTRHNDKGILTTTVKDFYSSIEFGAIPSTVLLPLESRPELLESQSQNIISTSLYQDLFSSGYFEDEETRVFHPLFLFELVVESDNDLAFHEEVRLIHFLRRHYKHQWRVQKLNGDLVERRHEQSVFLFINEAMTEELLRKALKLFLDGAHVVLDRSKLDKKAERTLEGFYLENNLDREQVFTKTQIDIVSLGEAKLLAYYGHPQDIVKEDLDEYWEDVIFSIRPRELTIQEGEDLDLFWMVRPPRTNEFNYVEVRRVCLFNNAYYKKKLRYSLGDRFVLIKVIDENKVSITPHANGGEIDFKPLGSLSLEFGVIE